jgi:hypothetical protein
MSSLDELADRIALDAVIRTFGSEAQSVHVRDVHLSAGGELDITAVVKLRPDATQIRINLSE